MERSILNVNKVDVKQLFRSFGYLGPILPIVQFTNVLIFLCPEQ